MYILNGQETVNVFEEARNSKMAEVALSSILVCPICLCLFKDPVAPPCQHTFCNSCLTQALQQRSLCPICRSPVYDYRRNLIVANLLDEICSQKTKSTPQSSNKSDTTLPSIKIIKLSMTDSYASHWDSRAGIREIVQNWYDGMVEKVPYFGDLEISKEISEETWIGKWNSQVHGTLVYDNTSKKLLFHNFNTSLERKILLLGSTSKKDNKNFVGKFGEGLKVGILALLREKKKINIRSGRELWEFDVIDDDDFGGSKVLCVKIHQSPIDHATATEISGVEAHEWELIKKDFLFLNFTENKVHTPKGTVLLDPQYNHKLYVKGFWISDMKEEGLLMGIDARELTLDRDRRAVVKRAELDNLVSEIWSQAILVNKSLVPILYDMLMDGNPMISNCPWHIDNDGIELLSRQFFSREGLEAFPVINTDKDQVFLVEENLRKKAVLCPPGLTDILQKATEIAPYLEILRNNNRKNITQVPANELTPTQQQILQNAIGFYKVVDPTINPQNIEIVQFSETTKLVERDKFDKSKMLLSKFLLSYDFIHSNYSRCQIGSSTSSCSCCETQIVLALIGEKATEKSTNFFMKESYKNILLERLLQYSLNEVKFNKGTTTPAPTKSTTSTTTTTTSTYPNILT